MKLVLQLAVGAVYLAKKLIGVHDETGHLLLVHTRLVVAEQEYQIVQERLLLLLLLHELDLLGLLQPLHLLLGGRERLWWLDYNWRLLLERRHADCLFLNSGVGG